MASVPTHPLHHAPHHHHPHSHNHNYNHGRNESSFSQHLDAGRSARSPSARTPPPRFFSPPLRQSSLGRAAVQAAQSIMGAIGTSPGPYGRVDDEKERTSVSDDEAEKGHGRHRDRDRGGRHTPGLQGPPKRRQSEGATAHDHTHTHAHTHTHTHAQSQYQSQYTTEPEELDDRALLSRPPSRSRSHLPRASAGSAGSDHAIQVGSSSPLVIPQPRRGAITLRQSRRRRRRRALAPRLTARQRFAQISASVRAGVKLLLRPAELRARFSIWASDTAQSWDEAFRDPHTGARLWRPPWISAYIPLLIWLVVSLSSTAIVLTFHSQVFEGERSV